MRATAIILRGGFQPHQLLIQLRKWQRYSHAGILMADGQMIDAVARVNAVIKHPSPLNRWTYERILSLDHLTLAEQEAIGANAEAMVGQKYGWRQAAAQGWGRMMPSEEDDVRRVICFELVGIAASSFLHFKKPLHLIDGRDIHRAWETSRGAK